MSRNLEKLREVRVFYSNVGGAHCFSSPDVKELCVMSMDLRATYDAVGIQLEEIFGDHGIPAKFTPRHSAEQFEQRMARGSIEDENDIPVLVAPQWMMATA